MGDLKQKHIGESKMILVPEQSLKFKLKDGSVTQSKLAKNSVTSEKIAGESITSEKLSPFLLNLINASSGLSDDILAMLEKCSIDISTIPQIYVGEDEPDNQKDVWVNENGDTISEEEAEVIAAIQKQLKELNVKVNKVLKLVNYGVVPGDATTSIREDEMSDSEIATEPVVDEEGNLTDGDSEESEPDTSEYESTVPSVNAKIDTSANFGKYKQNLTDGELVFFTDKKMIKIYYQGAFYGSSTSGGGSSEGGLSLDELYASDLEYLMFKAGDDLYRVKMLSDGTLVYQKDSREATTSGSIDTSWGVYISQYLSINTVFCGGDNTEGCSCSHNFVELANGSDKDINLNGIMLLYTDGTSAGVGATGYSWKVLQLEGYIKANSTFLIRGARCGTDKASFITVKDFDMEWYDGDNLISFNQGNSSFYLAVGSTTDNWVYDENGNILSTTGLRSPWQNGTIYKGYIDSCGFGTNASGEGGKNLTPNQYDDWSDCMFIRWFTFEPAKQGNKAYSSRKTSELWTYINLSKQDKNVSNDVIQYYYPDWRKQLHTPKSSRDEKSFFTNKTLFDEKKPNMINVTFGIQATSDSINNVKASRCFNWVSVGYYDEFLEYRKSGDAEWTKVYSITEGDYRNSDTINTFINHYKRLRWVTSNGTWVTTHKIVLSGIFEKGEYEYRVGRVDDDSYYSDVKSFRVWDNSEVTSFSFIQTTDQQGFNWQEYQAWKKSAYCISNTESDYCFTINTGDITQSGNRENEWLDYYDGRQYLNDKEEMFTIGNNDLCGHDASELTDGNDATSKYNHINVLRYFTFELDVNNIPSVTWNDVEYPIYSLYSFNFGKYHFVCLNSETAQASSKTYVDWTTGNGDATFANATNAAIEAWFKKDLQIWQDTDEEPSDCSKVICYMHEMPFTMVTYSFMIGTAGRVGSHLNTNDDNGLYRFSRLFKKYGIRLVIGGHKHTYTISKPIYDAPEGYVNDSGEKSGSVDLMGDVTATLSRKPVIQVLSQDEVVENDFARYELVSKISAPVYVMSQATGYKLVSNKEQPSDNTYTIPWLMSYFKQPDGTGTGTTENVEQHYPMYIRYDLTNAGIKVTAKQISGIWDVNVTKNTKSYDMNNQLSTMASTAMTLSKITDDDKANYGITSTDSYDINF